MQRLDRIIIRNETEELSKKNIHKGYWGFTVDFINASKEWVVCVFDEYNRGVFAVVRISEKDLQLGKPATDGLKKIWLEIIEKPDFFTHTELRNPKFKEYDKVMLMVDKPKYANVGLKKGDIGCVMAQYAIRNKWYVIFTVDPDEEDIDMTVDMDDIELVD